MLTHHRSTLHRDQDENFVVSSFGSNNSVGRNCIFVRFVDTDWLVQRSKWLGAGMGCNMVVLSSNQAFAISAKPGAGTVCGQVLTSWKKNT